MKILGEKGYLYKKLLSSGGEGEVHLVMFSDKLYAAKVYPALNKTSIDILKTIQEMNLSAIPGIHEIFDYEDKTIVIREYIEGNTLYDEIKKNEYLAFKRAKEIIMKICETLKVLHNAKPNPIIYRDLKPENIIITPDGNVKLIDFGIARYYNQESVRDTVLAGTSGYTAPEVMAGMQSDSRSDVYSAGLLLYEMLTGKNLLAPPYQIRPVKESNEYLPDWLDPIIEKATDLNQTKRYKSIEEFMDAIENPRKKHKMALTTRVSVGAAALLIILGGLWFYFGVISGNKEYEMILDLDFQNEEDIQYIVDYQNPDGRFEVENGILHVIRDGISLEYLPGNNMLVHIRMKTTIPGGLIKMSQYQITSRLEFECIIPDPERDAEMTTSGKKLSGIPIVNAEQWLDYMIYTNEENSAVYVVICDNESGKIAYTAYQIPEYFEEARFFIEIAAPFDEPNQFIMIDSIDIAEGSLKGYLADNMSAYNRHKQRMEDFFAKEVNELPQMEFRPPEDWR